MKSQSLIETKSNQADSLAHRNIVMDWAKHNSVFGSTLQSFATKMVLVLKSNYSNIHHCIIYLKSKEQIQTITEYIIKYTDYNKKWHTVLYSDIMQTKPQYDPKIIIVVGEKLQNNYQFLYKDVDMIFNFVPLNTVEDYQLRMRKYIKNDQYLYKGVVFNFLSRDDKLQQNKRLNFMQMLWDAHKISCTKLQIANQSNYNNNLNFKSQFKIIKYVKSSSTTEIDKLQKLISKGSSTSSINSATSPKKDTNLQTLNQLASSRGKLPTSPTNKSKLQSKTSLQQTNNTIIPKQVKTQQKQTAKQKKKQKQQGLDWAKHYYMHGTTQLPTYIQKMCSIIKSNYQSFHKCIIYCSDVPKMLKYLQTNMTFTQISIGKYQDINNNNKQNNKINDYKIIVKSNQINKQYKIPYQNVDLIFNFVNYLDAESYETKMKKQKYGENKYAYQGIIVNFLLSNNRNDVEKSSVVNKWLNQNYKLPFTKIQLTYNNNQNMNKYMYDYKNDFKVNIKQQQIVNKQVAINNSQGEQDKQQNKDKEKNNTADINQQKKQQNKDKNEGQQKVVQQKVVQKVVKQQQQNKDKNVNTDNINQQKKQQVQDINKVVQKVVKQQQKLQKQQQQQKNKTTLDKMQQQNSTDNKNINQNYTNNLPQPQQQGKKQQNKQEHKQEQKKQQKSNHNNKTISVQNKQIKQNENEGEQNSKDNKSQKIQQQQVKVKIVEQPKQNTNPKIEEYPNNNQALQQQNKVEQQDKKIFSVHTSSVHKQDPQSVSQNGKPNKLNNSHLQLQSSPQLIKRLKSIQKHQKNTQNAVTTSIPNLLRTFSQQINKGNATLATSLVNNQSTIIKQVQQKTNIITDKINQLITQNKQYHRQQQQNNKNNIKQLITLQNNMSQKLNKVGQQVSTKIKKQLQSNLSAIKQSKQQINKNIKGIQNIINQSNSNIVKQIKQSIQADNKNKQKYNQQLNNNVQKKNKQYKQIVQGNHKKLLQKLKQDNNKQNENLNKLGSQIKKKVVGQQTAIDKNIKNFTQMLNSQKQQIKHLNEKLTTAKQQQKLKNSQIQKLAQQRAVALKKSQQLSQFKKSYEANYQQLNKQIQKQNQTIGLQNKKLKQYQATVNSLGKQHAASTKYIADTKQLIQQYILNYTNIGEQKKQNKNSFKNMVNFGNDEKKRIQQLLNQKITNIKQLIDKILIKQLMQQKKLQQQFTKLCSTDKLGAKQLSDISKFCENKNQKYYNVLFVIIKQYIEALKYKTINGQIYAKLKILQQIINTNLRNKSEIKAQNLLNKTNRDDPMNQHIRHISSSLNEYIKMQNQNQNGYKNKVEQYKKMKDKQILDLKTQHAKIVNNLSVQWQAKLKQQVANLNSQNTKQIQQLKKVCRTQILKQQQNTQIAKNQLTKLNTEYNNYKELKTKQSKQKQQKYKKQLKQLDDQWKTIQQTLKQQKQKELRQINYNFNKLIEQSSQKIKQLESKYQQLKQKAQKDAAASIKKYNDMKDKYQKQAKQAKQKNEKQIFLINKNNTDKVSQLNNKHEIQIAKINKKNADEKQYIQKLNKSKSVQFTQQISKTLSSLANKKITIAFDNNYKTILLQLQKLAENSRFLPTSQIYNSLKQDQKNFIIDSIKTIMPRKIKYTKPLFQGYKDSTFSHWLLKIYNKPNLLLLVRLKNGMHIGAFSQKPYIKKQQSNYQGSAKGFLMSITNKIRYNLLKQKQGSMINFKNNQFSLGNDQLVIYEAQLKFLVMFDSIYCYFQTLGKSTKQFIGTQDDKGNYAYVQFHQLFTQ